MAQATKTTRTKATRARTQVRATRFLLTIITLVVMGVLSVQIFSVAKTILVTQVKLIGIYQDIQYCEEQRGLALNINRWEFAEEMDRDIEQLQQDRADLVNSDDMLVGFASQWGASVLMLVIDAAIFALFAGIWATIILYVLSLFKIKDCPRYLKVLVKLEERILVVVLAIVSGLLSFIFYLLMMGTGEIFDQTSRVSESYGLKIEFRLPDCSGFMRMLKSLTLMWH